MIRGKVLRQVLGISIAALIGVFLALWGGQVKESGIFGWLAPEPAIAQFVRPETVAPQVYQRLPDFPQENQYINQETGKVDQNNTLVSRLINYHLYVKSRPPNYRFDWKLTLADYLGANERLEASTYPGNSTLTKNPQDRDRAVIDSLTRAQRNDLIQALVNTFNPNAANTSTSSPSPSATPQPSAPTRNTPSLPKPGDADLLTP